MKKVVSILLSAMLAVTMFGCGRDNVNVDDGKKTEDSSNSNKQEDTMTILSEEQSDANYEEFEKVSMGETYDDAVKSLGEPNKVIKEDDKYTYIWDCGDDKSISVVIKDGVIVSKAEGLLDSESPEVTEEQYNKLKEGMTTDEAFDVLGVGVLTSEEKTDDYVKKIYAYNNSDGSSLILTFRDDKLYSMSENRITSND